MWPNLQFPAHPQKPSTKKFVLSILSIILKKHHKLLYRHNFESICECFNNLFNFRNSRCFQDILKQLHIHRSLKKTQNQNQYKKTVQKYCCKPLHASSLERLFHVCFLEEFQKFLNRFSLKTLLFVILWSSDI